MKVIPIPCLPNTHKNYAYLIVCTQTNQAAIVDPSEFRPVWQRIQAEEVELVAILNTHHHWDHVGANQQLVKQIPHLKVYGHYSDQARIPQQNMFLHEGDSFEFGALSGTIIHNPGHTAGGISYHLEDSLFVGDTLFSAGCGRLFEGTAQQLYTSLQKIVSYPKTTKLYFGHEYTESNLRFAQSIEPNNSYLLQKYQEIQNLLEKGLFTTPSTVEEELNINPFVRCHIPEVIATVESKNATIDSSQPSEVFGALRQLKDQF